MAKKTVKEIADFIGGELVGNGDIEVSNIKDINEAGNGDIAFILHPAFLRLLENSRASCVVVPVQVSKAHCPIIKSKNPSLSFRKIAEFLGIGRIPHPEGIHKTAFIGKNARIGKDVGIGPHAVIEDGAEIGDRSIIYPFVYIGRDTKIGSDTVIYPNVSIRENIKIGRGVIIHSGSVIGSDGFGFDSTTGVHLKIPQIGDVIIEDDVEIGACVTIDRAKMSHTRIGKGTKIDNLVQIAHNVEIGENCIIVAQCGISGSCKLGRNVIMGGQTGLVDHISIGDNVMIGAQAGIMKSVPSNTVVWGSPARPYRKQMKMYAVADKLPEMYKRLIKIEKILKIDK